MCKMVFEQSHSRKNYFFSVRKNFNFLILNDVEMFYLDFNTFEVECYSSVKSRMSGGNVCVYIHRERMLFGQAKIKHMLKTKCERWKKIT